MYHCVMICMLLTSWHSVSGADSDCPLSGLLQFSSDEGESEIPLDDACIPSEEPSGMCTFQFREGSVTYNGNTSGSVAFYNVSDTYCINSTMERVCDAGMWLDEVILEKVATQSFLQGWNIALIVIGVVAFIIGDGIAGGLGTMLAMKSVHLTDKIIAITMIVVSVVVVFPVAGSVALATYIFLKKKGYEAKSIQMKWWYRILNVVAILLKILSVALWIIQAGYSATQDFYGEGPLRDENGICVPHKANTKEKNIQDALVVVSHVLSLMVMIDLHIKALLVKKGTKSVDSTDSGRTKVKKPKTKEDEGHELSQFTSDPVDDTPSSPKPLFSS